MMGYSTQSTRPVGITQGSHITYCSLVFIIAYAFKGQVTSENCKSLVLQDKCNIEIFCPLHFCADCDNGQLDKKCRSNVQEKNWHLTLAGDLDLGW